MVEKSYACVRINNNTKGVPFTWILFLLDETLDSRRNAIKVYYFDEDPVLVLFSDTAPKNVKMVTTKPMEVTQ